MSIRNKDLDMSLPPPGADQAYCDVSALEAGIIKLSFAGFTTSASSGSAAWVPSLAFLLQHSSNREKFVFDLGIRKDWEKLPPDTHKMVSEGYPVEISQDVAESLAKGGTSPSEISTVCLSHVHFDHAGDTTLFPESTFLVGDGAKYAIEHKLPLIAVDLPPTRTTYLSPDEWQPLGPFPQALDFYGDGSLYIVNAFGHLHGHINVLARTSSDGAWIYLAGDSAHHWDLVTGKGKIAVHETATGFARCAHVDKEAAEQHLLRIRKLTEMPRIRVLLAHDGPWYEENKGGPAFWPGKIPSS
ncbi:putative metallo-beta-lactamase superfamily protein [Lyophyllum shimeji]|uniref:Metallo-beta-lactamase superfamily protein n=1 Tax=Lyophyllum shimeji TaxID=47721 RepID=A0A9P3PWG0_LYOSH|nr:putative metallo-beta-lactamase superfamily protein [Lyophyllum shimeji]